ncbi:MAG: CDP-diacylglycerol--serine O-phosphatidyltransferase [Vallitaleaceae bacterium]|jgi:CDP-diacylglycerol--serine O-phosphatidyltransferase|nr:CDP-diacylglycerol--serine O-phosphatidyltransferase [Vallitaleaceae bacterium]
MKSITKHIPNAITCLNIVAGCLACVLALFGEYLFSAYLILLAGVFDFFDGFAARLFKAYSPMGKELDSLADMVSFGVAPGFILYAFLSQNIGIYWALSAFAIPVFSALRLAKFNIDERQTTSFLGLPTPPNAIFWAFLVLAITTDFTLLSDSQILLAKIISVVLIPIFSFLLVSELPMFSLKVKNLKWKENKLRFVFLILSVTLVIFFKLLAFPLIILLYIILSSLNWVYQRIYVKSSKEI